MCITLGKPFTSAEFLKTFTSAEFHLLQVKGISPDLNLNKYVQKSNWELVSLEPFLIVNHIKFFIVRNCHHPSWTNLH